MSTSSQILVFVVFYKVSSIIFSAVSCKWLSLILRANICVIQTMLMNTSLLNSFKQSKNMSCRILLWHTISFKRRLISKRRWWSYTYSRISSSSILLHSSICLSVFFEGPNTSRSRIVDTKVVAMLLKHIDKIV